MYRPKPVSAHGGRGVLLGGVPGVYGAKVVVIGAGVAGLNAATIAAGMQAEVHLLNIDIDRLRAVEATHRGQFRTVASNAMRSNAPSLTPTSLSAPCWSRARRRRHW
ncbi:hypothetical protein GCM10009676_25140 [Prauserella halophila]|uniref:Alanine dehydrogenase/pyridine nucleotide transhydrogenase NAD(H)-binding domain-containing protein n=1 Tax=Prauserella halophila TaxID=185641 RepID=A0ABP4GUV7_9PSEU